MTTRARLSALLLRRYGTPLWDGVLRASGVAALAAIPALLVFGPATSGVIAFLIATIWVNGPLAIFFPATYEPMLMLMGRLYAPLLIAVIGVAGTLYVEFLNYHLYNRMLQLAALRRLQRGRLMSLIVRWFNVAPFFTVWLCSWSPLPYWVVRLLAPMAGYPVVRYLFATFLGRFPRLWFFAALGVWWGVSTEVLAAVSLGSIVVAVTAIAATTRRRGSPGWRR